MGLSRSSRGMKRKRGGGEYKHFDPLLVASMSVHSVTAHATLCECMLGYLAFATHPLWEISLKA